MKIQLLVLAKAPVPGRVKTRLCPPCTPEQAAEVAAAAIQDTFDTVTATPAAARVLVADGDLPAPVGWSRVAQRGDLLGERLTHAYGDTAVPGLASLLIGMDTPQVSVDLLSHAVQRLAADDVDAVLGLAVDGGWWSLGLRDPAHAVAVRDVVMSTAETGEHTLAALRDRGLRVAMLPTLSDVDVAADARTVAGLCPAESRFARTVAALLPEHQLAPDQKVAAS